MGASTFVAIVYLPAILTYLGGVHTPRQGEPTSEQFLFWLISILIAFIVSAAISGKTASALLKRRKLPLAGVSWYRLSAGYVLILLWVADVLPA